MNQKATEIQKTETFVLVQHSSSFSLSQLFPPSFPPAIHLHSAPAPHYFPQFFSLVILCSSVHIHSAHSCLALFPHHLSPSSASSPCIFAIHILYFSFPSLTGLRDRAPTNVTWLSALVPRTGAVPGIHKK